MIPLLILAAVILFALVFCVGRLYVIETELKTLKEELAVHFRLLHSIDRNVAELLTKAEGEEDI